MCVQTNLDVKGVRRVGPQLTDLHLQHLQPVPAWNEHHAVIAGLARSTLVAVATAAQDVVRQVKAVAHIAGRVPLQQH